MLDKFTKINQLILKTQDILLVTHPKPDGDALGSLCAMIGYLKTLGKNYRAYCTDLVPQQFQFLPWQEELEHDFSKWPYFQPGLVLCLDLPDWQRSGIKSFLDHLASPNYQIIVLDHHHTHATVPDLSVIDIEYSSTAEILWHFFQTNQIVLSKQLAECLLIGLLTDTENFTNPATRAKSLQAAGELMKLGANFDKLTQAAWRSRKFQDLKLIGLALERLQFNQAAGLAVTLIKEEDIKKLDAYDDPLKGLTNFLKGLSDGKLVLVLKEQNQQIKGSLRSIDKNVDVARLAEILGGGGHKLAAGFTMPGRLEKVNGHWQVV